MLDQFLNQLSLEIESSISSKDAQGNYTLMLNPELKITLRELDPGLYLFARIAPCPEEKESLFMLLMRANFLGQGTGGAVIGLELDEKFLTLSSTLPYDINYKTFKESLEDFANFIDYWREELERHKKALESKY